jgi:transcriptional regulator with XRE-family HTH domain
MSAVRLGSLQRYVAANIRLWRRRRGPKMTQEKLSELADLDLRHLQRIEQTGENITLGTLVAIANALGIAPTALFRKAELIPIRRGRPPKKAGSKVLKGGKVRT